MNGYSIDGIFLTKRVTGIQRYALEIVSELDKIALDGEIEIVAPNALKEPPAYQNIRIVRYGDRTGRLWEQSDFAGYLRKRQRLGIFLENTIPIRYPHGIVVVHDIALKACPRLYTKRLHDFLSLLWRQWQYRAIMRSDMTLATVSEFSSREMRKYYGVDPGRIHVIPSAWQHMERIRYDDSLLADGRLRPGDYFFAMSTLAQNKNFRWIAEAARQNPDEAFAIAGDGQIGHVIAKKYRSLKNLIYLGYVTDEQAKSLMKNCKAFLFPSFYEGFGLPPLEAIACGANAIIVSDTEVMREVYGDCANYIDPYGRNPTIVRDTIIDDRMRQELLGRYSWKKSAEHLYRMIRNGQRSER